jgi:hypothetical protein
VKSPAWLFLLRIAFITGSLLCFHTYFGIDFSIHAKEDIGMFYINCYASIDFIACIALIIILIQQIHEYG